MTKLGTVKFSGISGNRYKFAAYPLDTTFDEDFSGVFVVTRRREGKSKGGFVHKRICTGQGDEICRLLTGQEQSLSAKGANCICVHAEKDKGFRQMIAQDLVQETRPRRRLTNE